MNNKPPAYGIPDEVMERLEKPVTYKYRDPDKWREYMKIYMRGYRRKRKELTNGV